MTEILSGVAQSLLGKSVYAMPDNAEHEWRQQQYYNHMPMLTSSSQWADSQGSQMGGMQDVDLRMFQHDSNPYGESYISGQGPLISSGLSYFGDGNGPSDIEMGTPSTSGFPTEATEGYHVSRHSDSFLALPTGPSHGSVSAQSPKSAHDDSPQHLHRYASTAVDARQRPTIGRSVTAPETGQAPPQLKRTGTSEDGDDEYLPVEEGKPGRGRKRQRIPHTAVERRYRENLNAHLEKLRQAVPSLAVRSGATKPGEPGHDGVKPSKCEILNGAIEHIGTMDRENQALRDEVKLLRSRMEQSDRWNRNDPRSGPYSS